MEVTCSLVQQLARPACTVPMLSGTDKKWMTHDKTKFFQARDDLMCLLSFTVNMLGSHGRAQECFPILLNLFAYICF